MFYVGLRNYTRRGRGRKGFSSMHCRTDSQAGTEGWEQYLHKGHEGAAAARLLPLSPSCVNRHAIPERGILERHACNK